MPLGQAWADSPGDRDENAALKYWQAIASLPKLKEADIQKFNEQNILKPLDEHETEIFIETPYRNDALLGALLDACAPGTRLCIAADLTLPTESIRTQAVAGWQRSRPSLGKRPAVFMLLA